MVSRCRKFLTLSQCIDPGSVPKKFGVADTRALMLSDRDPELVADAMLAVAA